MCCFTIFKINRCSSLTQTVRSLWKGAGLFRFLEQFSNFWKSFLLCYLISHLINFVFNISICDQVTKTDDGLEAIVFTAQGDMRQVYLTTRKKFLICFILWILVNCFQYPIKSEKPRLTIFNRKGDGLDKSSP